MATTATAALGSSETANQDSITYRISHETLASCFAFLLLVDCFRVSYVSRYWCAMALSSPGLWARVAMEVHDKDDMAGLNMILARTSVCGSRESIRPTPWPSAPSCVPICTERSASSGSGTSMVESSVRCRFWSTCPYWARSIFRRTFWAGGLRSLSFHDGVLPRTRVALSTLVMLDVCCSGYILAPTPSFETLFDICPQLESLTIMGLRAAYARVLPRGRVSETLRALHLTTHYNDYDITQHYVAWQTPQSPECHPGAA
ncbi:hypothetical protein AURDEDRAFT_125792 [Auricularia subglabra TFB-10046 SS5]|nr:hypothetical protein AURDEDRAFT_125792 [Auricularia subglabra TFB-10046 SS5]